MDDEKATNEMKEERLCSRVAGNTRIPLFFYREQANQDKRGNGRIELQSVAFIFFWISRPTCPLVLL